MGVVNARLQLLEGKNEPFLLYDSGSVCGTQLHEHWTTKIEFICEKDEKKAVPKVIEDTNCTLYIVFPTKAVCQSSVRASSFLNF